MYEYIQQTEKKDIPDEQVLIDIIQRWLKLAHPMELNIIKHPNGKFEIIATSMERGITY